MWKRFYTQGAQEWGGIIVHNAAMNQNPKPELVLLIPCCCSISFFFYINFKHQLPGGRESDPEVAEGH